MPRRPCLTCGQLTTNRSRCDTCQRDHDTNRRPNTTARGYGSNWQQRAAQQIREHPRCAHCGATTDLTADHLVPLARGGDGTQLQTLCRPCNSAKRDRHTH